MSQNVTWYAVYEVNDSRGYDSDYTPCAGRDAAVAEVQGYGFAKGDNSVAYAVAVPNSVCITDDEDWSLWDHLADIPPENFVWIHRGSEWARNNS